MEAIFHGVLLALGLILPLGVQNVFIFSQGATQTQFVRALPATITAAVCDTLLILLAIFGLSAIVFQFEWIRVALMSGGSLFLLYMGYTIWTSVPKADGNHHVLTTREQTLFALSVSLFNPHAILDTIGVIGTSALKYSGAEQALFTGACIAVSWLWFISLTFAGRVIGKIDHTGGFMKLLNKLSALFIWGTAVYLIIGIF